MKNDIKDWTLESLTTLEQEQTLTNLEIVVNSYVTVLKGFSKIEIETLRFAEWSIQDILAHLAEWNKLTIENISVLLEGGTIIEWIDDSGIDAYNDRAVQSRRELLFYKVLLEFFKTSRALVDLYKSLTKNQLELRFREGYSFSIRDSIQVDLLHFYEHYRQLADRLAELRQDF